MYVGVNVCVWMCVGVGVLHTQNQALPAHHHRCAAVPPWQAKHPVRSLVGTSWTTCFIR